MEFKASVFYAGGEVQYTFPFLYLKKRFVKARYRHPDGTYTALNYGTDYTIEGRTLRLVSAGATTDTINIYRQTPTNQVVEFTDASVLRAYDLNTFQIQLLHISEENSDALLNSALLVDETSNTWNAHGRRIVNVASPTEDGDAVNLQYFNQASAGAGVSAANARQSELNAKQSEQNASQSEALARQYATQATNSASAASASESNARQSELNALQHAQEATAAITNVARSASQAKESELATKESERKAKVSEGNAKVSEDNAINAESTATATLAELGVLANEARNIMASYAEYNVSPWDSTRVYSYPDVVAYTDGNTYRCVGTNVTAGTIPASSSQWVRLTTRGGDDFFDIDMNGNLMPRENPTYSYSFSLDSNGDIMPKDSDDTLGREVATRAEEALRKAEEALRDNLLEVDNDGNVTITQEGV